MHGRKRSPKRFQSPDQTTRQHTEEIEMSRPKTIYALPLAFILIGVLQGCADLGPPGSIEVQTRDQVVCLNGLVDVGLEKGVAESVVFQTPGVVRVVNSIAVSHN